MTGPTRGNRAAWAGLALVLVLVVALTGTFLIQAIRAQRRARVPTAATQLDRALDLGAVLDRPHILFRSSAPGPTYGRVAAVPLTDPGGKRSVSTMSCDRIAATTDGAICLAADRGAITRYRAELLTGRLAAGRLIPITGIPSRARLSPDGSWAATTTFISGQGYGTIGFSTETKIVERSDGRSFGNLEKTFSTVIGGRVVTASDLNIWGVTFAPGPRPNLFYATVATGGSTWLARGDLRGRTLTAVREDAECPSLSPDGRTLVYKKRAGSRVRWRYHVLDLATGLERPLSETRSVDDQVEWLDNEHVLYSLARPGSAQADVWMADVRSRARPVRFMRDASSPAVVTGPAS